MYHKFAWSKMTLLGAWYGDPHLLCDVEAIWMSTLKAEVLGLNAWWKSHIFWRDFRRTEPKCPMKRWKRYEKDPSWPVAVCVTTGFLWLWIGRSSWRSRPRWPKLERCDPRKKTCQSVSALLESTALMPHFTSMNKQGSSRRFCHTWPVYWPVNMRDSSLAQMIVFRLKVFKQVHKCRHERSVHSIHPFQQRQTLWLSKPTHGRQLFETSK